MMATIYISVGTNIDRERHLIAGVKALNQAFQPLTLSSVYESDAVGFDGSPFYNMVIAATTGLTLDEVAQELRSIEFAHGREENAKKFSPRTLDLDLLLYNDVICSQPVELPRAEITENAFVLWPLCEIAADLIHPTRKQSYRQLWQQFDKPSQKIRKVPFTWPK